MSGPVKNYKVELAQVGSPRWAIVEKPTGQVIDRVEDSRAAKIKTNVLNGGNGFNGRTPPFFLERFSVAF